ncbi:MAG: sugar efflux transporter [Actinoplanes sp.]
MTTTTPTTPRLSRQLIPLSLIFVAVGLSTSFVGPYLALFLSEEVHAGPVLTTAFLIIAPVSAVLVSWFVGRLSDRRPIRRKLLILAALAGAAGTALTAVLRDYWAVLAITVTFIALAGTLFPQSFAYARQALQHSDPHRAALGTSFLRTLFSAAWVAGPPLAALLLVGGFTRTYGAAAIMYLVAALVAVFLLPELGVNRASPHPDRIVAAPDAARRTIFLTIAGFVAVQTPMTLGVQAMPLFISENLGGTIRESGLILGLCAALEIPLMLGFGWLTTRVPVRRLILGGVGAAIAYQAVVVLAGSVWVLAAAQVLNAVFIATVSGLGITYVQDLMPSRPGHATTMIANTFPAGQILAAPAFGLAQHFDYRLAYGLNLALCVLGLLLLIAARPKPSPLG